METVYTNRGGWFSDRQSSTGASTGLINIPKYVLAASLIVGAGTGAFADDLSRLQHNRSTESIISNPVKHYAVAATCVRTPTEDLKRIREVFDPAVSDLAKCFNISRQTIYNWLNREQPNPEHVEKLQDFALAADMFAESGITISGNLLKRKVYSDKSLFEVIRDGGSAKDAAQLLIQIVRHETSQRELLSARFAGRTISQSSADSDLMAANDEV
jgi:hypothetical protein